MRKNYKLKLLAILVIACVSIGNANAFIKNTSSSINLDHSEKWTEIQNENGVKLFFSEYELNNQTYLKIKLENITTQLVDFTLNIKKNSELLVQGFKVNIKANSNIELTDFNSIVVPMFNGETYQDISIDTNIK